MNAIAIIAAKEARDGLRNRWVVATTLLLAALSLSLVLMGSAPAGPLGVDAVSITVVSLSSLTMYLVPLIALMLSYDAVVAEIEHGTMMLLLAYPVKRWQVIVGKFTGHMVLLTLATTLGYGTAAVALILMDGSATNAGWRAFAVLIGSSVFLGAVFVACGYLLSSFVRERATAAGLAVAAWLVLVLVYDLFLLGLLVADQQHAIGADVFPVLLLANPVDTYRIINLAGFETVAQFSGLTGIGAQAAISAPTLIAAMGVWVVLPLFASIAIFARREL